jgi:hypothetical protein
MTHFGRLRTAAGILLRGERDGRRRKPIPAISPSDVAEIKRFFPRDKFFILGHARSGTTLVMRLVRLHPEVHCDYQAHFFTRKPLLKSLVDSAQAEEWLSRKSNRWNRGGDLSAVMIRAAADYIMEREADRAGKRIVGDKSPSSTVHGQSVSDLHDVFPDARLVYVVRDGRDVLVSERFRNFVEESRYLKPDDRRILDELRRAPEAFAGGGRSIFTKAMIRRVAKGWADNVSEIDSEGKRQFGRRYLALRYEDVLDEPFEQMKRLWEFLGVSRVGKSLRAKVAAEMKSNPDEEWQARRGGELAAFLAKGQSGNWRNLFTPADKAEFKAVGGKMLVRWGYERDTDW